MSELPEVLMPLADAVAKAEIVAATQRWLERAVIGLNLCPFAKSVHVKKQIRYAVSAASDADALLAELDTSSRYSPTPTRSNSIPHC